MSLSAVVLKLIELNYASWSLYKELTDLPKRKPSSGGSGRNLFKLQQDTLGKKPFETIIAGIKYELIDKSDALSYLDIKYDDLEKLLENT